MEQKMFCYQCQETAGCRGCTMVGVCGKQPDVAAMQDLLVYVSRGISAVTTALRKEGKTVALEINHLITLNLFTTITNANFDRESIEARIRAHAGGQGPAADPARRYRQPAPGRPMGRRWGLGGEGQDGGGAVHRE